MNQDSKKRGIGREARSNKANTLQVACGLKDLKTKRPKDQKTKQLKAGAVIQKTPKNAEKANGRTDRLTDIALHRVA